ncbi:MAG: Hsp70 family protein, partial [Anaerolineae bacterium]|nr:Hsp70 family protein [Anaerolineae bacterium]
MEVGIDFGTTNSSLARYDGQQVQYFSLDRVNKDPRLLPSLLYVTREQETVVGFGAAKRYIAENVGRPIRYQKRSIGSIEIMVAGTGSSPILYDDEVFVFEDVEAPGRLLQSIKTVLRDDSYTGTYIFQQHYSLPQLIALVLGTAKRQAEAQLGHELNEVVLGRPVLFSHDPEVDAAAQGKLLEAARLVGFNEVSFVFEPVAAAYAYHVQAEQRQTALVFDFGGGTLDFTIMRLGGTRPPEVITTEGVLLGGD